MSLSVNIHCEGGKIMFLAYRVAIRYVGFGQEQAT